MVVATCNTCGGSKRWETTLEDSPTKIVDLGPCPDCGPTPSQRAGDGPFFALQLTARVPDDFDVDELFDTVHQLLGCDTESETAGETCPIISLSSTTVDSLEKAEQWHVD